MMIGIADQCINRWPSILPQFGISPSYLTGKQTPRPTCGGKDRFRFDNKDGRGTYYCNKCGPGDGVQLVMMKTGWPFRQAAEKIREVLPNADEHRPKPTLSEERRLQALRDTWKASKLITAQDDAGRYLASRGLMGPFSEALRFVPKLKVTGENVKFLSAMIALVRAPDGTPHTMHRTYLQNGQKAAIHSQRRRMPGGFPIGSSVELSPPAAEMRSEERRVCTECAGTSASRGAQSTEKQK